MTLIVSASFGPNDIAGAPQALLTGGPHGGSVVEITDRNCESLTIIQDGHQATYLNSGNTNQDNQHLFTWAE